MALERCGFLEDAMEEPDGRDGENDAVSADEIIPARPCQMSVGIIRSTKSAVKLITDTA